MARGLLWCTLVGWLSLVGFKAVTTSAQPNPGSVRPPIVDKAPAPVPGKSTASIGVESFFNPVPIELERLEFHLVATQAQIHRVNDDSPVEVVLPGFIVSTCGNIWMITPDSTRHWGPPYLWLAGTLFGEEIPPGVSSIPCHYEVAMDCDPFRPMRDSPHYGQHWFFPPGAHAFQLRITCVPAYHQQSGYYRQTLFQSLIPLL